MIGERTEKIMMQKKVVVNEVIQRSANVRSIRMDAQGIADHYQAGQFMKVRICEDPQLCRWLSFSSSPTQPYIECTKKITHSQYSQKFATLKKGDVVEVEYAFGNFVLGQHREKITFLCGGVGITPVKSIIQYIVDTKMDVDAVVLYAVSTEADILFKEDFAQAQMQHNGLKICYVLCQGECSPLQRAGLINAELITKDVSEYQQRLFYVCGPPAMVGTVEKVLRDQLCIDKEQIIKEQFQGY